MNELLLTIAIPTYNRCTYLKDNLDVLLPQCTKFEGIVKIVVSDNASSDGTQELLSSYINMYSKLVHYNRNETNIGLQGNFEKAVDLSVSKYVFLMGDDDILSPNFIDIIMPYINSRQEYGIIHWGRLIGDADCNNNKLHNPYFKELVPQQNVGDFIKTTLSSTNFLSSCLFNKKCWILGDASEDKNKPGYGQFARLLYGAIELNAPCINYYLPLVLMRNPHRVWAKNWPIYFWCELFEIFKHLDNRIPEVFKLWVQRTKDKNFYNRYSIIMEMYNEPSYYRPYYNTICYVLTKKERILLHLVKHKPKIAFIERVYYLFIIIILRLFY